MAQATRSESELSRELNAPLLSIYGAGTILGAGIYVLVGEIAGAAGYWVPLAFLLAAVAAGVNGMVYAELATRSPHAGGPTDYVHKAFGWRWFSVIIGWMIVATGVVSAATITTGFAGYVSHFVELPGWVPPTALLAVLGGIAAAGAKESAWFMAVTTTLGVLGLGFVLWVGFWGRGDVGLTGLGELQSSLPPLGDATTAAGVFTAAFMAVYSFIGFEDIVHMSEEVEEPSTSIPIAIIFALAVAAVFYVLVSAAAVLVMEPSALADAEAPLVAVVETAGYPGWPLAVLSLWIICNGALAQIIMATRVIYGLGEMEGAPDLLTRISGATDTPVRATIVATGVALVLALFFPLATLASATSFIILLVFAASNAALIVLERREPEAPFDVPIAVPWFGLVVSVGLVVAKLFVSGGGH
jgi:amino acid transporter